MPQIPDKILLIRQEAADIIALLDAAKQPSLHSSVEDLYRRYILLASASLFESRITAAILGYCDLKSAKCAELCNFVRTTAIERKYHQLFSWREKNANSFFGLFGEAFKKRAVDAIQQDAALTEAMRTFLTLGNLRNQLVHENFATFTVDLTVEEIHEKYRRASVFVEFLEKLLV